MSSEKFEAEVFKSGNTIFCKVHGEVKREALDVPEDSLGCLARQIVEKVSALAEQRGDQIVPADAKFHFTLVATIPVVNEVAKA